MKPPWASSIWYDLSALHLELPTTSGIPYIMSFPFTEAGLTKAIKTMKDLFAEHYKAPTGPEPETKAKPHPMIQKKATVPVATKEQRAVALEVLAKMGLV